jgi:hypothetical protein
LYESVAARARSVGGGWVGGEFERGAGFSPRPWKPQKNVEHTRKRQTGGTDTRLVLTNKQQRASITQHPSLGPLGCLAVSFALRRQKIPPPSSPLAPFREVNSFHPPKTLPPFQRARSRHQEGGDLHQQHSPSAVRREPTAVPVLGHDGHLGAMISAGGRKWDE